MFTFEGAAYDVVAAVVGAILGAVVAFGMVYVMAKAFGAEDEDAGLQVEFAFTWQSLLIAFALGVLLTLVVVAFSAWRVSTMTIATAIRNLPEPPIVRRRRRIVLGGLGVLLGVLLVLTAGNAATPLMLGVSLVIVSLVPFARLVGIPDRVAYTVAGLVMVVVLMLPWSVWESVFGPLSMDFSTWIVSGLMIVVGAVWVIVYNADLLLGAMMAVLGRVKALTPLLRMSMAYPLRSRFRTGTTLAMFTLVVFTLVTGSTSTGSFQAALERRRHLRRRLRHPRGHRRTCRDPGHARRARRAPRRPGVRLPRGRQPVRPRGRRAPAGDGPAVRELPRARARQLVPLAHDVPPRRRSHAATRAHATSGRRCQEHVGLAVVDSLVVQRRDNFGFNVMPSDFKITGFYARRRQAVRPRPDRGARQADGREDAADDHRRPLRLRARSR